MSNCRLHRFIVGSGLVLVLLALSMVYGSAFGDSDDALVIYSGQHKSATNALIEQFEDDTGIAVKARYGSSNELAHQIVAEGERSPADIIYTEETSPLIMLAQEELLARIDAEALEPIPAAYRDEDDRWTGVLGRSRVIVYNPALINAADLPTSIFDLQDEQWQGKVAFVPTSGSFHAQISAMIKLKGMDAARDWLQGLKDNGKTYRSNSVVLKAVEQGEIAFGLINNYYWDSLVREKGLDNVDSRLYFFGTHDLGDMLTVAGMRILASSDSKERAQKFITFATSKEGQQILTNMSAQYPLNQAAETHPDLKPFSELTPPEGTLDLGEYSTGEAAIQLLQEVGLL